MDELKLLSLGLTILSTGLFSGLMFSLMVLMQPKWNQQSAAEYIADIQPFLKVGKGNPFVSAVLFMGMFAPLLLPLNGCPCKLGSTTNMLIILGLVTFWVGAFGITVLFNLPTYTALMALDAQAPAENWQALRQRFYRLNLSRFVSSSAAFLFFLGAVLSQV